MRGRYFHVVMGLLALGTALASCGRGNGKTAASEPRGEVTAATRYLVQFRAPLMRSLNLNDHAEVLRDAGGFGTDVEQVRPNLYTVEFPRGANVRTAVEDIAASIDVEFVEPDYKVHAIGAARTVSDVTAFASANALNDPRLSQQWHHSNLKSAQAWEVGQGSADIVVAVIDTGIDYDHEDLRDNMWRNPGEVAGDGVDNDGNGFVDDVYGWNFVGNNGDPTSDDSHTHGTHCAGLVGAVGGNGVGIAGMSVGSPGTELEFAL